MKNIKKWDKWETPDEAELKKMAQVLIKHIRFLKPEIIELIVKDNMKNINEWSDSLTRKNINPSIYLWDHSPCVYPGIRRHSGSKEISEFKTKKELKKSFSWDECVFIDDNKFPKELWSWSIRNTSYNTNNPPKYQLAHIFDHKDYGSRNRKELEGNFQEGRFYFSGLYTSATNTCFVPTDYLKPTDHNLKLRRLLQEFQLTIYDNVCSILPFKLNLSKSITGWSINDFDKPQLVGNVDFAKNFLTKRKKFIEEYLSKE